MRHVSAAEPAQSLTTGGRRGEWAWEPARCCGGAESDAKESRSKRPRGAIHGVDHPTRGGLLQESHKIVYLNAVRCSQSNAFLKNSRSRSPRSIPTQLYLYQHARAAPSSRAHTIAYDGQVTAEMMDTPRRAPGVGRRAKANG